MTKIEEMQAYWQGFFAGAAWVFVCFVSLATAVYFFLRILEDYGGQ